MTDPITPTPAPGAPPATPPVDPATPPTPPAVPPAPPAPPDSGHWESRFKGLQAAHQTQQQQLAAKIAAEQELTSLVADWQRQFREVTVARDTLKGQYDTALIEKDTLAQQVAERDAQIAVFGIAAQKFPQLLNGVAAGVIKPAGKTPEEVEGSLRQFDQWYRGQQAGSTTGAVPPIPPPAPARTAEVVRAELAAASMRGDISTVSALTTEYIALEKK